MIVQFQFQFPYQTSNLSSWSSFPNPFPICFNYNPSVTLKSAIGKSGVGLRVRVRCCISQVHSYGTVDYEKRPMLKWKSVYKKISFMEKNNPDLGAASILDQWEDYYGFLTKWDLCRVVRELRKYNRYDQALQVYEWMNKRERFRLSTSDAAIQLDLIAKVRGVPDAEEFFRRLPDNIKDKRMYGALQNSYVRARLREQAECLMAQMREKGYFNHALPFNVMMTLYKKFKDYDKVESMVSEMIEKNVQLDIYSYNIWLSCRGGQGTAEGMEQVFEQIKLDRMVYPNWTTFSIMATMYINMGELEKAEDCLRKIEGRITGRDRMPYHHLLSLYGTIGKKDEVYRLWNIYQSHFPGTSNTAYVALVASLTRIGDIDGAEKMYEEWVSGKTYYDPRIPNLLLAVYVRQGKLDKAESVFSRMVEEGGKPDSRTWEILAEGQIAKKRIPEALSYLREAFSAMGLTSWRLKPVNMYTFSNLCEQEGDSESKEILEELVRQSGILKDQAYASRMGRSTNGEGWNGISNDDGSEMLLNEVSL